MLMEALVPMRTRPATMPRRRCTIAIPASSSATAFTGMLLVVFRARDRPSTGHTLEKDDQRMADSDQPGVGERQGGVAILRRPPLPEPPQPPEPPHPPGPRPPGPPPPPGPPT